MDNRRPLDPYTPALLFGANEPSLPAAQPRSGHFFGPLAIIGLAALSICLAQKLWEIARPGFGLIGSMACRLYARIPRGAVGLACWLVAYGTADQPSALLLAATGSILLRTPLLRHLNRRAAHEAAILHLERRATRADHSARHATRSAAAAQETALRIPPGFRTLDPGADIDRHRRDARRHRRRSDEIRRRIDTLRHGAPDAWSVLMG